MENVNIIDAIMNSDKDALTQAFSAAMAAKVSDALEIKKVEIASNLLQPVEVTNEPTEVETEVSGTESDATSTES